MPLEFVVAVVVAPLAKVQVGMGGAQGIFATAPGFFVTALQLALPMGAVKLTFTPLTGFAF
jgi:hypothetical protein